MEHSSDLFACHKIFVQYYVYETLQNDIEINLHVTKDELREHKKREWEKEQWVMEYLYAVNGVCIFNL